MSFYVIDALCTRKWQLKQTADELKKPVDIPKINYFVTFGSVHQLALNMPSSPSKKPVLNTYSLQPALYGTPYSSESFFPSLSVCLPAFFHCVYGLVLPRCHGPPLRE
jgi:hypothetical protein